MGLGYGVEGWGEAECAACVEARGLCLHMQKHLEASELRRIGDESRELCNGVRGSRG